MPLKNLLNNNTLRSSTIIFCSIAIFYFWDFGAIYLLDRTIDKSWWFTAIDIRFLTLLPLLFPLVLTQTIREAGYFNEGYLVAIIQIILIVHDTKEKN